MRKSLRNLTTASLLAALALAPVVADAGNPVNVLILKEHGVGSAASAQEYVNGLIGHVASVNHWESAAGTYMTSRSMAETWIGSNNPHYGILSLAAFLDLRGPNRLEVIGSAEVVGGGGGQYFIVSSSQTTLAGCKGKVLGTDHGDDSRFIDNVVGKQDFHLADFSVQDTRRPMATVKAAARGEVECALIDDAQKASLGKVEGGGAVKVLWSSAELPPMVVVAFPSAPAAEKKTFKGSLAKVCAGAGAEACKEVGLRALSSTSESTYAGVIKDYGA